MDWVDVMKRYVPRRLRHTVQRFVSLSDVKMRYSERRDQFAAVQRSDENRLPRFVRAGVVKNRAHYHRHHVAACLELGVPFQVIDIVRDDWLDVIRELAPDLLLAWPDATMTTRAKLIKDRLDILERDLDQLVVPRSEERWLYEDKARLADWLRLHGIPHARTWSFVDRAEALEFASSCELPIVFKTGFGAAAAGVRVLRRRRDVFGIARRVFDRGVVPSGHERRDRQWGVLLLQRYVDVQREWRIVRLGERFSCRLKSRLGDFHSGSGLIGYAEPPVAVLDFARLVTEVRGFSSMAVDVFEKDDGGLLVNELQAVFGAREIPDSAPGSEWRGWWRHDAASGSWRFERGQAYRNACANERLEHALSLVGVHIDIGDTACPPGA